MKLMTGTDTKFKANSGNRAKSSMGKNHWSLTFTKLDGFATLWTEQTSLDKIHVSTFEHSLVWKELVFLCFPRRGPWSKHS